MKPMPDQIGSSTLQKSPGHLVLTFSMIQWPGSDGSGTFTSVSLAPRSIGTRVCDEPSPWYFRNCT